MMSDLYIRLRSLFRCSEVDEELVIAYFDMNDLGA
jgi:hypothetical protein